MNTKRILHIIEIVYCALLLMICGIYVLWLEFESSLGSPPLWLLTAVKIVFIPSVLLLLKEGIDFIANLLRKGDSDA